MTDKARNYGLWPEVTTIAGARSAVMYGVWAALFSAIVTALLAAWALGSGRAALGFVNAWAFVDAAIFAAIAFGIYKESRVAAVFGLVFFVGEKILQVMDTGSLRGSFVAIIIILCYAISVRGTVALHKLRAVIAF